MKRVKPRAFTLVELLVVIGIIAVLISILLPTLSRVRRQSNTVACAGQLRSTMQLLLMYASENRSSMPWGFAWQRMNPDGSPVASGGVTGGGYAYRNHYMWWTTVNDMATKSKFGGLWPTELRQPATIFGQQPDLNKSLICPETMADDNLKHLQVNTYGFNMVIMPNQSYEVGANSIDNYSGYIPGTISAGANPTRTATSIAPAKLGQLHADNAVLWDVQLWVPGGGGSYRPFNIQGGVPWTGIDKGTLKFPAVQRRRYRGLSESILPEQQDNRPIWMPTEEYERSISPQRFITQDLFGSSYYSGYFPNVRYRHGNNDQTNVGFADGSVRTLKANFKRASYVDSGGIPVAENEFLRSYLKIKKPGALPLPQLDIE